MTARNCQHSVCSVPDRRALWNQRLGELARERSVIVNRSFAGSPEPGDTALRRHLERELDWYEMQLLRPAFERLEREARAKRKLARQFLKAVNDLREATVEGSVR